MSLLLFFSLLSLLSGVHSVDVNPCAPNWHYYNETGCCYKTTSEIGTWFQGSAMCSRMRSGSHLASLRTERESKFVTAKYKNGIDGIHAWTGLSQTQVANNWTFTDGSEPWSSFFGPFYLLHNHTSCVEIVDNWLVELFQNSGKTQPTFCYHLLQSLCKYCPVPVVTTPSIAKQPVIGSTTTTAQPQVKVEKMQPKSVTLETTATAKTSASTTTTVTSKPVVNSTASRPTTTERPTTKAHNVGEHFRSVNISTVHSLSTTAVKNLNITHPTTTTLTRSTTKSAHITTNSPVTTTVKTTTATPSTTSNTQSTTSRPPTSTPKNISNSTTTPPRATRSNPSTTTVRPLTSSTPKGHSQSAQNSSSTGSPISILNRMLVERSSSFGVEFSGR